MPCRLLCLCLLFAIISPAQAGAPPKDVKSAEWHQQLSVQFSKGTKRTLLIGIDDYKPPLSKLGACVNDIHLLTEVLHRFCGYERDNIHVLINQEATTANIAKKLTDIIKASREEDAIFISYGGHGTLIGGRSYFCTYDMDPMNAEQTALSADELRAALQLKKVAQKILYIDSCHSGGAKGLLATEPSSQELAGPFEKASGLITLAGCRRSQTCIDFQKHGVFTGQFARGLAGEADFDKNGIVDSDEIYRHLLMEVPATAKMVDPKHQQVPVRIIGEDVVGVFALAKVSGKPSALLGKLPARPRVGDVIDNAVGMKLIYLPSGLTVVGSPAKEYLRNDDEPLQPVIISAPIFMGVHEVTQDQYEKVMGKNPSYYSPKGDGADAVAGLTAGRLPVEQVSWADADEFCKKLTALPEERMARRVYRLPTECEWEHACRAGTLTTFFTGNKITSKQANIKGDKPYLDSDEGPSLGRPAVVGSYPPNAFGLHDMHGNVAEWCQDFYAPRRFLAFAGQGKENAVLYQTQVIIDNKMLSDENKRLTLANFANPQDPTGPQEGDSRVFRGGAFLGDVSFARSACRRDKAADYAYRGIGFRVVCYLVPNN